jgi:cytochrome c oxidase cbb3-type subunit 3
MAEFTSSFWGVYIAVITVVSIIACAVFLKVQTTARVAGKIETTGHTWDEDLAEWNNPLPNWWRWLFYITIVFSLVYLALYPGLAVWGGALNWTSSGQYAQERARAEAAVQPLYDRFGKEPLVQLAGNAEARAIGQNLFLTYCAQCHSSDARGGVGFPNLTDPDWLYGGDPEMIEQTILNGRAGVMPPFGPALGGEGAKDVANYVLSLSGLASDSIRAQKGKELFAANCVACHGPDGKGNPAIGAPNLTDKTWLYSSSEATIIETVTKGRNNQMPAFKERLGAERVHILAAYIWGLSHPEATKAAAK